MADTNRNLMWLIPGGLGMWYWESPYIGSYLVGARRLDIHYLIDVLFLRLYGVAGNRSSFESRLPRHRICGYFQEDVGDDCDIAGVG